MSDECLMKQELGFPFYTQYQAVMRKFTLAGKSLLYSLPLYLMFVNCGFAAYLIQPDARLPGIGLTPIVSAEGSDDSLLASVPGAEIFASRFLLSSSYVAPRLLPGSSTEQLRSRLEIRYTFFSDLFSRV